MSTETTSFESFLDFLDAQSEPEPTIRLLLENRGHFLRTRTAKPERLSKVRLCMSGVIAVVAMGYLLGIAACNQQLELLDVVKTYGAIILAEISANGFIGGN